MKKKLIAAVVVAVAALFTAGGTLAWFTDDRTANSVIQTGNVDIEVLESTNEPEGTYEKTSDGIVYSGHFMPGQTFSKIVTVRNKGINSAYVRVKVSYQDHEKKVLRYEKKLEPVVESSGFGSSGDSWELGSDGYYYYNQALKPGGGDGAGDGDGSSSAWMGTGTDDFAVPGCDYGGGNPVRFYRRYCERGIWVSGSGAGDCV